MVEFERFTEGEIPYEKLAQFGLTREMVDDLPSVIQQRMLSSRETPVLPIITVNQDGEKIKSEARISLVRMPDGSVDVALSPKWESYDLSAFTDNQQRQLLGGKVIIADMEDKGECYVQFDETIQQVMSVPVAVIKQNISLIERNFSINGRQSEDISKGKIIQMADERGNITSLGIDLQAITGLRAADGDALNWQREAKADQLPEYSFGMYGCWKSDVNGNLSYIAEKDFTPEIDAEMRRVGQQNATGQQMRQMHV